MDSKVILRAKPDTLDSNESKAMIQRLGFFDSDKNPSGRSCFNVHQLRIIDGDTVIFDYSTGLTWQQAGSHSMRFEHAREYVRRVNDKAFAGFNDWRLPTLEEAMSLMEPIRNTHELYVDRVFDEKQLWIWTSDKYSASRAWGVYFFDGICVDYPFDMSSICVRAVR